MTRSKWRLERKESLAHKLTKERAFKKFNKIEKTCIFGIILFISIFAMSYNYYSYYVLPNFPPANGQTHDPFTTLWNGTITSSPALASEGGGYASVGLQLTRVCPDTTFFTCGAAQLMIQLQSNGILNDITVGAKKTGAPTGHLTAYLYSTGSSIGNGATAFVPIATSTNNIDISTLTASMSQQTFFFSALALNKYAGNNWYAFAVVVNDGGVDTTTNYVTISGSSGSCTNANNCGQSGGQNYDAQLGAVNPLNDASNAGNVLRGWTIDAKVCPPGYQCLLSSYDANGSILNSANSTFGSVALTNSPITTTTGASKELLIFETWNNNTALNTNAFGWYLTANQTLPLTAGYTPLNDTNVVMAVIVYWSANGNVNAYVYQQKTNGQAVLPASGLGTNPYPVCPQTSTLYECSQVNLGAGGSFHSLSTTLNYTGCGTGTTSCGTNEGLSLLCNANTPATLNFCASATNPPFFSPCANPNSLCATQTLPFLNLNSPYYLGFWSSAGQSGTVKWGTGNSGTFDKRANAVYYWVPNPTTNTPAVTSPPSFFGWLGQVAGTAFTIAGNTLGQAFAPILNVGGSILSAFISGFVQALSILIQGFRIALNFIGNLLGLGNIGDTLVNALLAVGSFIINGLTTVVSFFTAIGNFITSGYLSFLAGVTLALPALIALGLTIWGIVFNGAFSVSTILFCDYLICVLATKKKGLRGFFAWISFNVFIFTFLFNMAWAIFDIVTRPIHRTKQTIDPLG